MSSPKGNCIALADLHWNDRELIGSGQFGDIYRSTWSTYDEDGYEVNYTVAIKDLYGAPPAQLFAERDAKSELSHPNILQLMGFAQINQQPMLVFEYTEDDTVWSYIRDERNNGGATAETMMRIACDIAKGMDYLHYMGIIHGDLATRNCIMVADAGLVKVGDLGFYDDKNSDCYYTKSISPGDPCPVRWMAPENLPFKYKHGSMVQKEYDESFAGDVWSFGVVLFEIWTRGRFPFDGLDDEEVCRRVLNGETAESWNKGINMRAGVRDLMCGCWQFAPQDRPDFSYIVQSLQDELGITYDDSDDYNSSDGMDCGSDYSDF